MVFRAAPPTLTVPYHSIIHNSRYGELLELLIKLHLCNLATSACEKTCLFGAQPRFEVKERKKITFANIFIQIASEYVKRVALKQVIF